MGEWGVWGGTPLLQLGHIRLWSVPRFAGNQSERATIRTDGAGKLDNRLTFKNGAVRFGYGGGWNELRAFPQVTFPRRAEANRTGKDLLPNDKGRARRCARPHAPPQCRRNICIQEGRDTFQVIRTRFHGLDDMLLRFEAEIVSNVPPNGVMTSS